HAVPGDRASRRPAASASAPYTTATAAAAKPPIARAAPAEMTSTAPSARTANGDAGSPSATAAGRVADGRRIFETPANASTTHAAAKGPAVAPAITSMLTRSVLPLRPGSSSARKLAARRAFG